MNCQDWMSALHDYFLQRLPADRLAEVDAHARTCRACGALLRTARELSCQDFTRFLNEYIDGELSPERRAIFDRHLAICPDCTNYLQSYRQTMKMSVLALRDARDVLPPAIPDELVLAILEAGRKEGIVEGKGSGGKPSARE
jgi:anti-sigma factor RsiW